MKAFSSTKNERQNKTSAKKASDTAAASGGKGEEENLLNPHSTAFFSQQHSDACGFGEKEEY